MRHSTHAFCIASVLHQVFLIPQRQSILPFERAILQSLYPCTTSKTFSTQPRRPAELSTRPSPPKDPLQRLPRNEEITSRDIYLVLPDKSLSAPRPTSSVLSTIDLKRQALVVVQSGEAGNPPVCKIIDKAASYAAEKALKKSKKVGKGGVTTKALELNWGIDNNDLGHRLTKVKEFLGKGYKVEILCAPKRRAKKTANMEEAEELVRRIKEAIDGVEGAKERKGMEGKLLQRVTIFAEGKAPEESKG